jgi:NADPH:quinone reductase-like Zn-dependent oxidoreductase
VRAAVLTAYGSPPAVAERAAPVPGPGQAAVRVTAAPIAPLDLLCATGTSYFGPPALPYVPGVQGVGVLDSGARVFFSTTAGMAPGDGSLAERAVAAEADLVPVPGDVPDALVAALGLSAVAAWMALTWRARMRPGERVLVLGAGGTVGQVAAQAAAALGASAVVAASRRAAARRRALDRGATAVVDLAPPAGPGEPGGAAGPDGPGRADSPGRPDSPGGSGGPGEAGGPGGAGADRVAELAARMREAAGGPVDVVVDPVGGDTATAALLALADHGRLVHLGAGGGPTVTFSSAALRSGSHEILGYTNNALDPAQKAAALSAVLELAATGRCDVTRETVALAAIGDAWTRAGAAPDGRLVVLP